ncbi:MAG: glycerophosphodiester phosphodiesterase [Mycobacterium sp.]|nr:glycerophosphodiester phosphodiesterase [Mycobacterium sp.]
MARITTLGAAIVLGTAALLPVGAGAAPAPAGPMIIAHRGGTGDSPENTVLAITNAVDAGADAVWLTVQASADGIAVLYRPADLAALTNGTGAVNTKTAAELTGLNAGWTFSAGGGYPYRTQATPIPTLDQAIAALRPDIPLFLDLKQKPAGPVVVAVAETLRRTGATARATIYSTDAEITELARQQGDLAVAESRDRTRQRLLEVALAHRCDPPPGPGGWAGFELHRDLTVTEEFTLGTGVSDVTADLWDPESVGCFTSQPGSRVIGFAVNTAEDYRWAAKLGMDAVLVDSPRAARQWPAG